MAYLGQYLDRSITVKADDTAAAIVAGEVARLQQLHAVLLAAVQHPRRLGGDAAPEELSADKRRAKRALHVVEQCLRAWGGEPAPWEEAGKVAATLDFKAWWEQHETRIRARQKYIATWFVRYGDANGDKRFTNKALSRLDNEHRWLESALR